MGEKSGKKKEFIIQKARDVFARKGFLTVTMKDIVEECGISRGGLYLYFEDTGSLFLEVLKKERESDSGEEIDKAETSVEMLSAFLREQKKEILGVKDSLIDAIYEYCFYLAREQDRDHSKQDPSGKVNEGASDGKAGTEEVSGAAISEGDNPSSGNQAGDVEKKAAESFLAEENTRFHMSVKVLHSLIRAGIREGYLDCEKPLQEAYNIMFAIEGLKICAVSIGVTEEEVSNEINFLFSHLFIREDEDDEDDG
ncbi:MAG: TetR/AcrR family transcriptional regulator [Lachnospiraceae bacterium]|nr:TetR/AcrR family transcriptional regulator [Lachnospiraceae bacterium]